MWSSNVLRKRAVATLRETNPTEDVKEASDGLAGKHSSHYCSYEDEVRPESDTRVHCAGPRNSNTSLGAADRDVAYCVMLATGFLVFWSRSKQVKILKRFAQSTMTLQPGPLGIRRRHTEWIGVSLSFGRCLVQILTETFLWVSQTPQANDGKCLKIGLECFLQHPFRFLIILQSFIRWYVIPSADIIRQSNRKRKHNHCYKNWHNRLTRSSNTNTQTTNTMSRRYEVHDVNTWWGGERWGRHGGEDSNQGLLGCGAVRCCKVPKFRRNTATSLHGVIVQKLRR
jgi:hypothetical protein